MKNNITRLDLDAVIDFLRQDDPILTHARQVREFEQEWSDWLGVPYSVFVNSGASANLLTMSVIKEVYGPGEVIVPTLTWVSDIASVIQCGFKPVFVDIDPRTLGMDNQQVIDQLTPQTRAVFLTHVLGYNALSQSLLDELASRQVPLIEDVCESYGATFGGRKLGTFGLMSNFSFYYAHHLTTIEGGMISTHDRKLYEMLRMFRSHGLVRESCSEDLKRVYWSQYPDLNPDFIFALPAYNVRPTEINAVLGRSQLKRLDANNQARTENLRLFLQNLDPELYQTDFATEGSCNYALTLILRYPDDELCEQVMQALRQHGVEFRRGTAGGGNQLRQPYLRKIVGDREYEKYPNVEHVHFYGFYIGNYPDLEREKILELCAVLNDLRESRFSKSQVRGHNMSRSKERLDLVLINPGNRHQVYQALGANLAAIEPPIWAGLMATFMRNRGFSVRILDANAENLSPAETAERVADLNPLLAAVVVYGHNPSASTQLMPAAGAICTALKQRAPETKVLLVGGHVAALPERTLREEDADFVCGGEGLYTLLDLVQALKSSQRPDFSQVRDLWYWEGTTVKVTPPAPLVKNLDQEMPGLAWDLLPMDKYRAHNWHCFGHLQRQPYAALYTTLGCPYRCTFCCIQAPFKRGEKVLGYPASVNSYRLWSPQAIIAQIDRLVNEYGVRNLKIADELFVLNPRHVIGICDLIIERGYDLNIWAYARVDTVRDEMVEKLKRAGVNWLAFGIEAASARVRDDVAKGFAQDDIFTTLDRVRAAGINIGANYIFGLPEDDHATMQATLDLALELNTEYANFYCTMAYPGSRLYATALQEGWPLPEKWSGYSQHSVDALPLPTKYLSSGEVLRFRDHAFQVYFNSPAYLEMIRRKFGSETVQHIREMAAHKLTRKNVSCQPMPVFT